MAYLHRIRHAVVCIITDLHENIFTQLEEEKQEHYFDKCHF